MKPLTELHEAWNAGSSASRGTRQKQLRDWWPALADGLDGLKHIAVIQYEAAIDRVREQSEEHHRIAELVLGKENRRNGRFVTDVVKLGEDYLVQVKGGIMFGENDQAFWTFVVNGKHSNSFAKSQESALLHLIATRYDKNPNSNHMWAAAAARVLGVPEDGSSDSQ